jgi:catechol 2,3-dioxygenase-like lactoylglutathione lyase family enzyme
LSKKLRDFVTPRDLPNPTAVNTRLNRSHRDSTYGARYIVVSDTEASLRLYRDILCIRVIGENENSGAKQAHLSLVEGAHLRITSLGATRADIEFLQRLAPIDGRPVPANLRPKDIVYRHTTLLTHDENAAFPAQHEANTGFISQGVISFANQDGGFRKGLIARDPHGHAIQVVSVTSN